MPKQTSKAAVIVKKKVWLPIIAPALFNNQQIGEMYLAEDANPAGRRVSVSLMVLTGDPQKQNVHISFDVTKKENNKLLTKIVGYSIVPAAVRKMMRRARERIDDSFCVKTKDDIVVRVKPALITRGKTTSSILKELRSKMRAFIAQSVASLIFVDFIKELVAHKFQRQMQDALRKTYPLQACEIRDTHIETSEKKLKNIIAAPQPAAKPEKAGEKPAETPEQNPAPQPSETA